jgi:hypothetical protein
MRIHLHVGAHKTATTYLQKLLKDNLELLRNNGIGYLDLQSIRDELTYKLRNENIAELDSGELIKLFFGRPVRTSDHTLIISDENLVGTCWQFLQSGQLYPTFEDKIRKVRRIFYGHEISLFFSVRSYDTFIASAYCEGIRNLGKYRRFNVFREMIDWETIDWPSIIQRMIESSGAEELVLWRFEEFRTRADDIVSRMTRGVSELFPEQASDELARPSFSDAAIKAVDVVDRVLGRDEANKVLNKMFKTIPKSKKNAGFDPWSEDEKSMMLSLYEKHMEKISNHQVADLRYGRRVRILSN